jgi:hypothetical protein
LEQTRLFGTDLGKSGNRIDLGGGLFLEKREGGRSKGMLYRGNTIIKEVDLVGQS